MATKIGTIQNPEKTEALLPRTCLKAIADKNGDYISEDVLASDINALKNGKVASMDSAITSLSTTKANFEEMGIASNAGGIPSCIASWLKAKGYPTGVFCALITSYCNCVFVVGRSEVSDRYRVFGCATDISTIFSFDVNSSTHTVTSAKTFAMP